MSELIDTTEMYLRTVFELEEEGITALRARIAERLGHSGPTVSQTVARMERDGLLVVSEDRHLELTLAGRSRATEVMRKHRLAERLLTDVIGLEWPLVHDEACRWEHVMSERVEQHIVALLGHPTESPYGTPIPGLPELGDQPESSLFLNDVVALVGIAEDEPREVVVRRLGESVQSDTELLRRFCQAGVCPGAIVKVEGISDGVSVGAPGAEMVVDLPNEVAGHVFVTISASKDGRI